MRVCVCGSFAARRSSVARSLAPRSPLKAVCATGHPVVDSSQCAAGTVAGPSRSFCVGCDAGFVASSTEAKCDRCPEGRYSGANASSCLVCAAGSGPNARQSECTACAPGTVSTSGVCTACPVGRFSSGTGGTSCSACAQGRFSGDLGSATCAQCKGNAIASVPGSTSCQACAPGQIPISSGGHEKAACGQCAPGTQPETDSEGTLSCKTCSPGFVSSGSLCTQCPQGTLAHPNRTRCMACTSRGVKCTASAFSVDDGFWWTPGYLQTDIDVDGSPWMYLPPGAPMHTCPTTKACNVTLNNVLARARAAAASLARTNQTLTSRRQAVAQLLQASLAETGGGVSCSEGHVGPRCAVCDAGYSRVSGNSDCVPCLDSGYNWAVVAAGLVIVTG